MAAAPARTAVVTGTARPHGIGRACARAFVRAGYRVLGVDRLKLQDEHPDEALGGAQSYAHVVLDISVPQETAFVPRAVHDSFDTSDINVLINNAGIADPLMPASPEEALARWRAVIDTNLTGAFLMSQACIPHMPAGAASIVHISSTRAHQSEPHTEAYAAAKAGLLGLAHAQAVSLAHKARVNTVLPGWIDTSGDPGSITPADHAWHPAGRVGRPEDVAELALFLADPQRAGFITGQQFVCDGGVRVKMVYPEEELAVGEPAAAAAAGHAAAADGQPQAQPQQEGGGGGAVEQMGEASDEEGRPQIQWPDTI